MKKPLPFNLRPYPYIQNGDRAVVLYILHRRFCAVICKCDTGGAFEYNHAEEPHQVGCSGFKWPTTLSLEDLDWFKEVFAKYTSWESLEVAAKAGDDDALYATCWFIGAQAHIKYETYHGDRFQYLDSDIFFHAVKQF